MSKGVGGWETDCSIALRASFRIILNGEPVAIETIGQAYRFITREFQSLHHDAKAALEAAAENAMPSVRAINALRALFVRAKLL